MAAPRLCCQRHSPSKAPDDIDAIRPRWTALPSRSVIDVLDLATPASPTAERNGSGDCLLPSKQPPSHQVSQVSLAVGDQDPSPSSCGHDATQFPGKYLVMDVGGRLRGKDRQVRFYLPDVPAKMCFYYISLFLAGLWMAALGVGTLVVAPELKWAGLYATSGIVGDPLLPAFCNLFYFPMGHTRTWLSNAWQLCMAS
mmetsp:Transcript_34250/g.98636  ORF Transcript_34250/g.98636 Transcript_34250/m.98636 type:complete len:198 (+) Transcript_34250:169-762(+)